DCAACVLAPQPAAMAGAPAPPSSTNRRVSAARVSIRAGDCTSSSSSLCGGGVYRAGARLCGARGLECAMDLGDALCCEAAVAQRAVDQRERLGFVPVDGLG